MVCTSPFSTNPIHDNRNNGGLMPLIIGAFFLLLSILTGTVNAQPRLERSVLAAGAVSMSGGGLHISATIAQPAIGVLSSTTMRVGQGFWYRVGSLTTHMQEQIASANTLVLEQNYPNPFGPATSSGALQTRINFFVPESGHATLALYDAMGRQLAVLIDEHLQSGAYAVQLQARDIPAGLYFYRLKTASHAAGRKLLLLR
jgi:hypothetical protein